MSGGSFDYLCVDLMDAANAMQALPKLRRMIEYAAMLYPEAVPHLETLLTLLVTFAAQYEDQSERLYELTKEIEWHASGDHSIEDVLEVLAKLKSEADS